MRIISKLMAMSKLDENEMIPDMLRVLYTLFFVA